MTRRSCHTLARLRLGALGLIAATALLGACTERPLPPAGPRSVVLFIGDGMGLEQVRAGSLYLNGSPGTLSFESFPTSTQVTTHSALWMVTDSAAAATAMATGHKVLNGTISMDGAVPVPTVMELASERGQSTGIVTSTYVTHATPAAFAAHELLRSSEEAIAADMLTAEGPTVVLGGGGHGVTVQAATAAGYLVVTTKGELDACAGSELIRLWGQFGEGHLPYEADGSGELPGILEMTQAAVTILALSPSGFFLMVEGGRIDHACHANDAGRMVAEVAAFDSAVAWVYAWSLERGDTLVVVTADHETGGVAAVEGGVVGAIPSIEWTTTGHTGVKVGLWAAGPWSELIDPFDVIDNTDVFRLLTGELYPHRF